MVTEGRLRTAQSANHPLCLPLPQQISLPLRDNRLPTVLGRALSIIGCRLLVLHQVKIFTSRLQCRDISHRAHRDGSGGLQVRRPQYRGSRTMVLHLQYLEPIAEERLIDNLDAINEFTNINMLRSQSSPSNA